MVQKLISTRDLEKNEIPYNKALIQGLAPDGGLYVLKEYPKISMSELSEMKNLNYTDLVYEIKKRLIGGAIPDEVLKNLIKNTYSREKFGTDNIVPVRKIGENVYVQNLSLGPTAAFKDVALQQLGQEMNYELNRVNDDLVILGATSGDTGSAAEAAMKGLNRIKLFMLSPKVGMSAFQKAQMGVLSGDNIFNISVDGRFDDCQDLVKNLKQDLEFSKLGAVNSINWGRISSQIPYFFSGYFQTVQNIGDEVDFVIPTGNFGNILSGYIAKQMGLPIRRLIAATNENDVVSKLINTGIYELSPAVITSSPSMDISKSSNYERLLFDILGRDPELVRKYMEEFVETGNVDLKDFDLDKSVFEKLRIYAGSSNHSKRIETIKITYEEAKTIIDPHTADCVYVGKQFKQDDIPMICMETALPVKFEDTIKEALGFVPERSGRFEGLESDLKSSDFYEMSVDADKLKDYIRENL